MYNELYKYFSFTTPVPDVESEENNSDEIVAENTDSDSDGSVTICKNGKLFHCLTIIGEIEGHTVHHPAVFKDAFPDSHILVVVHLAEGIVGKAGKALSLGHIQPLSQQTAAKYGHQIAFAVHTVDIFCTAVGDVGHTVALEGIGSADDAIGGGRVYDAVFHCHRYVFAGFPLVIKTAQQGYAVHSKGTGDIPFYA